jgi:hypothetical protein
VETQQHRYSRILRAAAEALGSEGELAAHLGVSPDQLARWASGIDPAPFEAFLAGLDVIARGSFARKRRIRVAVLDAEKTRSHETKRPTMP